MLSINLGELLKETILLLITLNVIYFLLPRWTKRLIKGFTKFISRRVKEVTLYAKKHSKNYYKQHKKATLKSIEQPLNVITITYPNGRVKRYPTAK